MGLFGKKQPASAVVIDIGSSFVGGAFVSYDKKESPLVSYTTRIPAHLPGAERSTDALIEAIETLVTELIEKGGPEFARSGGSWRPDQVIISIGSPWQETRVETNTIEPGKSFVVSSSMLAEASSSKTPLEEGKKYLQKEVVATLLNGYATTQPVGKRAERAEVVTLMSIIDSELMAQIAKAAKRLSPRDGLLVVPFAALAYDVLRTQYPHEREFLLMRVSGEATSLLFASRGLVMDVTQVLVGLDLLSGAGSTEDGNKASEQAWVQGVTDSFRSFATRHALPRILFLVAEEVTLDPLKQLLNTQDIHRLWLSDEPLTVIPVVSRLLSSLIRHQGGHADPDVTLDLLVLFAQLQIKEG